MLSDVMHRRFRMVRIATDVAFVLAEAHHENRERLRMEAPLISVVIPVYNSEAFLRRSVGSVQRQSYERLEILLVDDGSADGSYALMRSMAEADERIRIFHKENGGASSARNLGVAKARGDLIGFVDSDDWIEPDMIESLVEAWLRQQAAGGGASAGAAPEDAAPGGNMTGGGAVKGGGTGGSLPFLVQTGRMEEDESGHRLPDVLPPQTQERRISPEEFMRSLLLYTGDASYCTKLTPRALLLAHPFPEGTLGEDFRLHMEMLPDTEGVLLIPKTGYHVVHRAGSATRRANAGQFSRAYIDIVRQADYVEDEVVKKYPALRAAARRFGLYERMDYMLHVPIGDMHVGNAFYVETLRYLRSHFADTLFIPVLTVKNRLYLALFTLCPRLARNVHRRLRRAG
ncbi:glycosyltransferase family 2 protein [Lachnoclostridium sp. Marseille-P6806]|uniref:glycosyltransferase family 2 protein n=1 Tax=Lachnoclostridium sp. Marseille-P6806 TaxID=2364793 RepID=UPI001F5F721C|nr:glycosyltransferase [Lachnoclostridium sp. Marseille-P6806]